MNVVIDMNLSPAWDGFLTEAGFVAVHWSDEGSPHASDEDLLRWAAANGYVVLSAGWDLPVSAAQANEKRPGVLVLGGGILTPERYGTAVESAIRKAGKELAAGAVIRVAFA